MPRERTSDINAEQAVAQFKARMQTTGRDLSNAWLTIAELLVTCEVWNGGWQPFHNQPVVRERNDYKLCGDGSPNTALREATLIGDYLAQKLAINRADLCANIGGFLKGLGIQPN